MVRTPVVRDDQVRVAITVQITDGDIPRTTGIARELSRGCRDEVAAPVAQDGYRKDPPISLPCAIAPIPDMTADDAPPEPAPSN